MPIKTSGVPSRFIFRCIGFLMFFCAIVQAKETADDQQLQLSVEQLRSSVGMWSVTTEFLNADGSVAKSVTGTYEFSWVVPDRVVAGKSDIPQLNQTSGILFYINEKKQQIEMVAVGADGQLWIMTGALGDEVRYSQVYKTANGGNGRLRFTRFKVKCNSFESRMEYTDDDGKTWQPGNHQLFTRIETTSELPGDFASF